MDTFAPTLTFAWEMLECQAINVPEHPAVTYLADGETEETTVTYADLWQKARAVGATLQQCGQHGKPVLICQQNPLEYLYCLLGCFASGAIATPSVSSHTRRHAHRLHGMIDDSLSTLALLPDASVEAFRQVVQLQSRELQFVASDLVESDAAEAWQPPTATDVDLALLQYTSGSTRMPRGVMVTHANLLANINTIHQRARLERGANTVLWLPLFHDMGLVSMLYALFSGAHCILFSPAHFSQKPLRWLRAISKYQATHSGGPNFAYSQCAHGISESDTADLDLACWRYAFMGAEPVRAETIQAFTGRFSKNGFRKEAIYPCYGLAEFTLKVCGGDLTTAPIVRSFDREQLSKHNVVECDGQAPGSLSLVGCGEPLPAHEVEIVDPRTREVLGEGKVGEIWARGPSKSAGYWRRGETNREVFDASTAGGESGYLRTGDLGFRLDGELFVTGRINDLIIVRGANHFAEDIEWTVRDTTDASLTGLIAAFSMSSAK